MKLFNVVFTDGCAVGRPAEDVDVLVAEIAEEFPGREIKSVVEAYQYIEQNITSDEETK